MSRFFYFLLVFTAITFIAACKKDAGKAPEEALYGVWVKGSNTGDTIRFYNKDGRHIMQSNQSFNPLMFAPLEQTYSYRFGQLSVTPIYSTGFPQMRPIESFTWIESGREFEVSGYEFYMFMSATMTKYTFTKVQ